MDAMDKIYREKELDEIDDFISNHDVKRGPTAFCAVSLQAETSGKHRYFEHSYVRKKWRWPRSSRGNRTNNVN